MKKNPIILPLLIVFIVFGFFFYISFRNEKKTQAPREDTIVIKQPAEVDTSKYNSDKGK